MSKMTKEEWIRNEISFLRYAERRGDSVTDVHGNDITVTDIRKSADKLFGKRSRRKK